MNGKNLYWFSPNFKFQVSSTNTIHFFPYKDILLDQSLENSSKNIFWKEFFLWKTR